MLTAVPVDQVIQTDARLNEVSRMKLLKFDLFELVEELVEIQIEGH